MRGRLIAVLTTMLAAASMIAGCATEAKGVVTVWTYPVISDAQEDRAFWERTVARFERTHPNIKINLVRQPWSDADATLSAALMAGKGPDVGYLIPGQVGRYQSQGVLRPIEEVLGQDALRDYRRNAIDAVSVNGTAYVAPILMSVMAGTCDKRVLDAANVQPPKTWQDVLEMAPKLKSMGFYPTYYQADLDATLNQNFYQFLWQAGGKVFKNNGNALAINDPEGVRALEFLKRLVDGGYLARSGLTQKYQADQSPMAKGKVACVYNLSPADASKPIGKENAVVAPPLKDKRQAAYGVVGGFAAFKDAKDPEATATWMKYLTSPEVTADYNRASGYSSPRKSVRNLHADDPVLGKAERYLDLAIPGEPHPRFKEVMTAIAPQIQAALLGKKTPKKALDDAVEQAEPILQG